MPGARPGAKPPATPAVSAAAAAAGVRSAAIFAGNAACSVLATETAAVVGAETVLLELLLLELGTAPLLMPGIFTHKRTDEQTITINQNKTTGE